MSDEGRSPHVIIIRAVECYQDYAEVGMFCRTCGSWLPEKVAVDSQGDLTLTALGEIVREHEASSRPPST